MAAAKSLKTADKQAILKKLVTEMKKHCGGGLPKQSRPALETLLFAALLENSSTEEAEQAYSRLIEAFFDLNEIRVSSVTEIENSLGDINDAAWKAMRIREALQHTFEKHYVYDLDSLRRKTQDQAAKELEEIPHQTPFIRNYTIQHALDSHVLPIDQSILQLLQWLGLADQESTPESAGDDLKSAVKKADAPLLCHLLKEISVDPKLAPHFEDFEPTEDDPDPHSASKRLAELIKNPRRKSSKSSKTDTKKKSKPKSVTKKRPTKKKTARPAASKKAAKKKTASKKVSKKKPAKKKKTARRA